MGIRRDVERVSAPFELPRRLLPTLLLIVGVWLTFSTYERPFLMVSAIEPAGKTARPRANAQSLLGPQAEEISAARERKIPLVTVGGDEWTAFFDKVSQSFARGLPVPEWGENIGGYDRREIARAGKAHLTTLYSALDDSPFRAIAGQLSANHTSFLRLEALQPVSLKVFVSPPYHPNLGGSGSFSDSYYPRKYAYPLGSSSLYVMVAGLLIYLVLPWPRGAPNVVEVARWRVIGMDFMAIVWMTDQSGNFAMKNLDRLADAMEHSKVPVKEGTLVLRGIFPPQR